MKIIDCTSAEQCVNQNHSSKGDQPKWLIDNNWYKADYMGYEGFAETIVSRLLQKSSIQNFVKYEPAEIMTPENKLYGCVSANFKAKDEMLVSIERLHRAYQGEGLADQFIKKETVKEKIKYTVDFVTETTGIEDFADYLTIMLELDMFFLNEDRHTNNIAVMRNERTKKFRLCPYFDHGLSLLSDCNDYPMGEDVYTLINKVKAKPFDRSFEEQVDAAEELYGTKLQFYFTRHDVEKECDDMKHIYTDDRIDRVKKVIFEQMRRYSAYF